MLCISYSSDISVHQVPSEVPVSKRLHRRKLLTVLTQKLVRGVIHSEILIDALALDIGIIHIKVYHRLFEILYCNTVSAEAAAAALELSLQFCQILFVQNKSFKLEPFSAAADLDPAVKNVFYRMRNEKCSTFFRATPVPLATQCSGSSATLNGMLILSVRRLSSPRSRAPPPVR